MKIAPLLLAAAVLFLANGCSNSSTQPSPTPPDSTVLVASTPGGDQMKAMLGLESVDSIDFIRWELALGGNDFTANLHYGICKPNTLGFLAGGEKKAAVGILSKTSQGGLPVFELRDEKAHFDIRLIQLGENIFHLLSPDGSLMVGNGGWSYTLNREQPLRNEPVALPAPLVSTDFFSEKDAVTVYDGRTPCTDFAEAYQLPTHENCIKLKWRLTLRRDPATGQPTTCTVRRILREANDLGGTWRIQKGTANNPKAIIYQLVMAKMSKPLSLLVGDENVLFLLYGETDFFVGDEDFSYTFNRKP